MAKNNSRAKYFNGSFQQSKRQNHFNKPYIKYKFPVPNKVSEIIPFLKEYYRSLTDLLPSIEDDCKKDWAWNNHYDLYDQAIAHFLNTIQLIKPNKSVYCGSQHKSGITWVCLGKRTDALSQYSIAKQKDLFVFYNHLNKSFPYQEANIHLPANSDGHKGIKIDELKAVAKQYNQSVTFCFSVALNWLYDSIVNCGPDTPEFWYLFTRDPKCYKYASEFRINTIHEAACLRASKTIASKEEFKYERTFKKSQKHHTKNYRQYIYSIEVKIKRSPKLFDNVSFEILNKNDSNQPVSNTNKNTGMIIYKGNHQCPLPIIP